MVEDKIIDVDFGKRLFGLREKKHLSREAAAKEIGIGLSSLQNYERGSIPIPSKMEKILLYYKCDRTWLREGDPRPKSGIPEPSAGHAYIKDAAAPYPTASRDLIDPTSAPARDFSIDEDLILATSVLKSRTHYATALHLNIRSFVAGVSSETTISKCLNDLRTQGELIAQLQARLDERDKQDNKLREEIKELKRTSGDCPPTALGMDHAARTGTEDREA